MWVHFSTTQTGISFNSSNTIIIKSTKSNKIVINISFS